MCIDQEKNESKSPSDSIGTPNKKNLKGKPKGDFKLKIEKVSPVDNSISHEDPSVFSPMDYRKNPNFIPNIAEKLEKYEKLKEHTRKSIVQTSACDTPRSGDIRNNSMVTPMKPRKKNIDRWLKTSVNNPMRGSVTEDDIKSIMAPSRPSVKSRALIEDLGEAISQNLGSLTMIKTGPNCLSRADSDLISLAGGKVLGPDWPQVPTVRKSVNLDKLELDIHTVELGVKNFITQPRIKIESSSNLGRSRKSLMVGIGRPVDTSGVRVGVGVEEGVEILASAKRLGFSARQLSTAFNGDELESSKKHATPDFDLACGMPNFDNLSKQSGSKFGKLRVSDHSKTNLGRAGNRRKSESLRDVAGIKFNGSNRKKNKAHSRKPRNFSGKSEELDGMSDSKGSGSENYDGFEGKELLNKNRDPSPEPRANLANLDKRKNRLSILFNVAPVIEESGCDSDRSIYETVANSSARGFAVENKNKSEVDSMLKKFYQLADRLEFFDGFHLVDLEDILKKVKIESEKIRKHINSIGKFFKLAKDWIELKIFETNVDMASRDNTKDKTNYLIGLDYLLEITDLEEKLIREEPMLTRSGHGGESVSIGKISRGKKKNSTASRLSLATRKNTPVPDFDPKPVRDSFFCNYRSSVNVTSLRDALKSPTTVINPKPIHISSENFRKGTRSKSAFGQ